MSYDAQIRVNTKIGTKDLEKADKEVDKISKKLDSLYAKGKKMEALGARKNGKQWASYTYDVAQTEAALETATSKAEKMHAAFNAQHPFKHMIQSAKSLFGIMDSGTKKTNTGLTAMYKMFKRIVMRMLIMKAIMGVITSIKTGINNLVQYSADLNEVFSDLKSSSAELKNSLATAFAPILTMIIPYITQLISWLNTAMNYIAQFWAILGGKSTYTKAKKQVVDYAKSLGAASKEAKGALAAFDEINVLNTDTGSGAGGGGELSGANAFEEAPVDSEFAAAIEKVKAILEAILPLVILVGAAFWAWKLHDFLAHLSLVSPLIGTIASGIALVAGSVLAVYSYFKMWKNGVDWIGIIGYVTGITIAVTALYMLCGPLVAGIALIAAAVAGVVLALKDMCKNGVTTKNMALLLISAFGILAGVFLAFGSAATVVVGIVMAVIAALAMLVSYSGNGSEALEHLRETFQHLGEFVSKVFKGDFEGAMEDLKKAGKSFGNFFISVAEGVANGFIKNVRRII